MYHATGANTLVLANAGAGMYTDASLDGRWWSAVMLTKESKHQLAAYEK
jgi:hypothetical protein